jgi:steroid delta-isomerase-like uncharacterized protein
MVADPVVQHDLPLQPGISEGQERNRRAVYRVLRELWEKGDMSVADEVFTKDFVRHDPHNPDVIGPEGNKDLAQKLRSAFPDLNIEIHDLAAAEDRVIYYFTVRGTHLGTFAGIAPTNAKVKVENFCVSKFNDAGKSTDTWVCSDYLGVIRQIVTAMSFWQKLMNIRHIWRAEDVGRYSAFGQPSASGRAARGIKAGAAAGQRPVFADLQPQKGITEVQQRNRVMLYRGLREFWEQGIMEFADEAFTADFRRRDPHNPDVVGPEGYKELVKKLKGAFPDMMVEIHEVSAFNDRVMFHATIRGTHLGRFAGVPPTKAIINLQNMTIARFDEKGMCVDGWVCSDYLGLIRQLIRSLSIWQVLFNLHHIIRQKDFGRSPDAPFGDALPPTAPQKQLAPPATQPGSNEQRAPGHQ